MTYIHTQFAYLISVKIFLLNGTCHSEGEDKWIACFVMWGRVVSPETQLRFGRKNAITREFLLPRIIIYTHLTPLPWLWRQHVSVSFRFLWPCIVSKLWRERENQQDATVRCLLSILSQHVSGIIMPIFRRTRRVLLHVVCCAGSAGCGW